MGVFSCGGWGCFLLRTYVVTETETITLLVEIESVILTLVDLTQLNT